MVQKITVMAPADFELLINLVGPKNVKIVTKFVAPLPVQEGLAVTFRFLTAGDSYTRLQYTVFSKCINKKSDCT
jgi:hypothetical protein